MVNLFSSNQSLKPILHLPRSNRMVQAPAFARVGNSLYLSYFVEGYNEDWQADLSRDPGLAVERHRHAVLHFPNCVYFSSEMCDDDMVERHRLGEEGLKPFSHFEVKNSELVKNILDRRKLSAEQLHKFPSEPKHFVFSMHGYVFEVVSAGFRLQQEEGSILSSLERIMKQEGIDGLADPTLS